MRCTPAMNDRAEQARPAVVVYCADSVQSTTCVRQIDAGLEEEGIPSRIEYVQDANATELAFAAANASNLDVGVGVDVTGRICIHHAKLPADRPALVGYEAAARDLGHNAARLVSRIPFKIDAVTTA